MRGCKYNIRHPITCGTLISTTCFFFFFLNYIHSKFLKLMLCSLIGAVLIVVGFYFVMWGKATEEKVVERGVKHLESSCHNVPLLQNKT